MAVTTSRWKDALTPILAPSDPAARIQRQAEAVEHQKTKARLIKKLATHTPVYLTLGEIEMVVDALERAE